MKAAKYLRTAILCIMVISVAVGVLFAPARAEASDPYRPLFHFTPKINYMNDPNGLVFDPSDGYWHMFFQYSNALSMKQQHWGHARSLDLVNWEEMPEAMQCDMMGKIYTGSCVVDEDNTTGFFTDNVEGESKLVAIFTHCDGMEDYYGFSKQSIAFSKDHGLTWEKYSGNPVINNLGNIYGHGFRDPKVVKLPCIWTKTGYIWTMFCGADGIRIFTSEDLINWEFCEEVDVDREGYQTECPDIYRLPVEGTNKKKWVLMTTTQSTDAYVTGSLKVSGKKVHFEPDEKKYTLLTKTPIAASQAFYNDPSGQNRNIVLMWMRDSTAKNIDGKNWNGAQTIPMEAFLKKVDGKYVYCCRPVEELMLRRSESTVFELSDTVINTDSENPLAGIKSNCFDLELTLSDVTATTVCLEVLNGDKRSTLVEINLLSDTVYLDRRKSGIINQDIVSKSLIKNDDGTLTVKIMVDVSIVDVFVNGGTSFANLWVFPEETQQELKLYVKGGSAKINTLKMWSMAPNEETAAKDCIYDLSKYSDKWTLKKTGCSLTVSTALPVFLLGAAVITRKRKSNDL